jgi:hypothetical protein
MSSATDSGKGPSAKMGITEEDRDRAAQECVLLWGFVAAHDDALHCAVRALRRLRHARRASHACMHTHAGCFQSPLPSAALRSASGCVRGGRAASRLRDGNYDAIHARARSHRLCRPAPTPNPFPTIIALRSAARLAAACVAVTSPSRRTRRRPPRCVHRHCLQSLACMHGCTTALRPATPHYTTPAAHLTRSAALVHHLPLPQVKFGEDNK